MVDALGGHTAAQNTLGAEGLRDGDALSSTTLSNLLQGLRGNGIIRLQDTAYGSTRNAVNNQPGAVVRNTTHTLNVQGGYVVLDGVLYEFGGGPGGSVTVTIGSGNLGVTGTPLAASGEQSMYVVYLASQGGMARIHVDGGSPVQTSTGLYPQLPSQFLIDYDTGGSILNDQVVALATLRCSFNAGGGTHKIDVQEVNDKRIFTRSNPIYMTPLSSGTIVTDGSELSQISKGAAEGINTAAQLNALFSGNEAGVLGNNTNGSTKIDVGALWMSTGRSGTSLGYGPGDGVDRSSNRMNDDLFFAGQNNNETGVITKRLFTEGVAAPTGALSTASYTISSHGDKWFIFAPANGATITLNPEKSGSTYLFPEGHVIEVCNSAAANGGNIVFDSTGLNTTLLPDQRATFIFEGSTWLRCDYQAAISTMAFTTLTDTPSSLGSAGQHIRVNSGGTAFEFIDSPTLTTEEVQDVVGGMFSGNTETDITATYQDSDGTIDLVVAEQRTDAQVKDLAGALFTGNTETFITATYQTSDDTVDLVVPVHDEDDLSSNSATHLATQQSIKAYVDTQVSNVIDSAPGALDTLNELAAAINDDASFHTTITTALSNRVRVDTASQGLTSTQKSNARTNMGLGTLSTLSAVDISDNTNLSVSSPLSLTGDTLSIANIPFGSLHADAYQTSSESFANNDTSLMTSAAIEDKILSYGYSTTTGTVTSVATGTGLTGGSITSSGTISLSHLGLENLSDPNADRILFWDDSAGVLKFLTAGSNLAFSGTTLNATNTNQLTTFTIRDDDNDAKTIAQGKFIKFVSATGTAGTNWSGAGTTGDPFVMTITNPDTQLTGAQVKDFAGAMFTGNTETFITATYQTSDDTVDLVVPVLDEDNMASNSASHLATQQSIKSYVDTEVSNLIASAPGTLDTLNELAAAINDDASFHTTMTTALGNRLRVDTASQGLTGTQKSNARTNLGLGSMALLSSIDISDNTNLAAGTGIDLTGDTVSVDVSDFMTNGSNNRLVTATGTDAMNAEANLTFDGSASNTNLITQGSGSPILSVQTTATSGQQANILLHGARNAENTIGQITFSNNDNSGTDTGTYSAARVLAYNDGGNLAGGLKFQTTPSGSSTTLATAMTITENSRVGILTETPEAELHVEGSLAVAYALAHAGQTGQNRLIFGNNTQTFQTAGTDRVTIASNGKVGIGTTSPQTPLHVVGNVMITNTDSDNTVKDSRILGRTYTNNDYNLIYGYADATTNRLYLGGGTGTGEPATDIRFYTAALNADTDASGTEAMRVTSAGRLGIGDTTPSYKLDVAGDINLTGDLRQNGNVITTHDLYNNEITLSAGTGLTGGGAFTLNQQSDETLTFNVAGLTVSELAAGSLQTSSESFADNDTSLMTSAAIQDKIESYGYSTTTGDITNVSAGVGISGGGGSGSVTLTLDMSELPDMTQAVVSSEDELIILDNGADKRKLISEIPLSAFNNDSGFITNNYAGDFTAQRLNLERSSGYSSIEMGGPSGAFIDMKNPFSDDFDVRFITSGTNLDIITANAASPIQLKTQGTTRVKIEDAQVYFQGKVGIGTTSPSHKLQVTGGDLFVQNNDIHISQGAYKIKNASDGTQALSFPSDGNFAIENVDVAIGSTTPRALLDVTATNNPTILLNSRDAAHAAGDKIGSLLFYNNEDSSGETGSRVGAGVRFVATDAYGRGNLELTSGTSDPMGSYNAAEVYTDNSIARLKINSDTGHISLPIDSQKLYFGADNDMFINHSGSEGLIQNDTGLLNIDGQTGIYFDVNGSNNFRIMSDHVLTFRDLRLMAQTEARFYDENNNHYVGFESPDDSAYSANVIWKLPPADGSNGHVLQTDGAGNLSFAAASGGGGAVSAVANGSNNRIATFSSADALNGESALTFDGTILGLTGNQTIDHNATDSSVDNDFGLFIDHDSTGSTATGGDREQGGLYVNAVSNATGGDLSDEHRLYGVWSDTRISASGDADAVYAIYGYAEDQRNGTSGMTNISAMAGVYGVSASDGTNAAPTVSAMYGTYGYVSIQDTGTVSNTHGTRGLTVVSGNRAANINNLRGLSGEVDIGGSRTGGDITINWARVVESVFDHNVTDASGDSAVVNEGFLYYGDYAVSQSDQVTTKWGLYINDEDKNYISGKLGIGTTAPDAPLHVEHSTGVIAKMGEGNVPTQMTFADARASVGYHGDALNLQSGSGNKSIKFCVNNGTWGSGEAARFDTSGNFGIGTTSPSAKLHVDRGSLAAASLTFGASAGQIFTNENSEFAFGLHNASPYPLYIQGRTHTDGARQIVLNPLGGNVGIGALDADDAPLHVKSAANDLAIFESTDANAGIKIDTPDDGYSVVFFAEGGTNKWSLGKLANNSDKFSIYDEVNTEARVIVDASGKVGINNTSPTAHLDVTVVGTNNTTSGIAFGDSAGKGYLAAGSSFISVATNDGTTRLAIDNGGTNEGNVGIGTTTPSTELEVAGTITVTGNDKSITFDGGNKVIGDHSNDGLQIRTEDTDPIVFKTNGNNTRMSIEGDGKVGIGTVTPENRFQINHTGADADNGMMIVRADTSTAGGDLLGGIGFDSVDGNDPSSVLEASAGMAAYAAEAHGSGDKGGTLTFFTSPIDQNDDTAAVERMRIKAGGAIMFQDDNPLKTIRVHADTNSSPTPRIELMRGTHDTWGSGDNYNDWRIENANDLIFYAGTSSISSGAATERFRIHSDADGITVAGNVKSDSKSSFNTMQKYYYQRTSMGSGTVDLRVPPGGDGTVNPNGYPMPRAGKVMALSLHYYAGSITTNSGTDTWRIRKFSGGSETTLDVDVARTSLSNPTGTNYTTTVELASPLTVAADDILLIKRQTSGGSVTHVSGILYVAFDL